MAGVQAMGDALPDVVGRRGDNLLAYPNAGTLDLGRRIKTNLHLAGADALLTAGDWDRDGYTDVITRDGGTLYLYRGSGTRKFSPPVTLATGFGGVRLLAAVGDMTGDGFPDLMGQPSGGSTPVRISAMVPAVDSAPVVSWVWWVRSDSMAVSPARLICSADR